MSWVMKITDIITKFWEKKDDRKRILVIEDDAQLRDLYYEILGHTFQVDLAKNGKMGFDKASQKRYDLIITDLQMEQWNGADTIAAIDLARPDGKYIIVSGYLGNEDYQSVLKTMPNICCTLAKPFHPDDLIEAVLKALPSTILSS